MINHLSIPAQFGTPGETLPGSVRFDLVNFVFSSFHFKAKLIKLNIQNTAVCNCHKDDELSKMLKVHESVNEL